MKYHVYFLHSKKDNGYYIGCTSLPVERRLYKHNAGHVRSTKARRPFKIIYYEEYPNKLSAFKRERYLKCPAGYQEKLQILQKVEFLGRP
jgi:putative endonuclease